MSMGRWNALAVRLCMIPDLLKIENHAESHA